MPILKTQLLLHNALLMANKKNGHLQQGMIVLLPVICRWRKSWAVLFTQNIGIGPEQDQKIPISVEHLSAQQTAPKYIFKRHYGTLCKIRYLNARKSKQLPSVLLCRKRGLFVVSCGCRSPPPSSASPDDPFNSETEERL